MPSSIKQGLYLLAIFSCIIVNTAQAQKITNTESRSFANIYNDAIRRYITKNLPQWNTKPDTIFIEKTDCISDSSITKVGAVTIIVFDWPQIQLKLEKEVSFVLCKFFPLAFDRKDFYISVIPFHATKTASGVNLGNGGGCHLLYSFDNLKRQFRFKKMVCKGI